MPFFIKVVEARQFDGTSDSADQIVEWVTSNEGQVTALELAPSNYVIKEPNGFVIMCKEDFLAQYQPLIKN
jgi:hypothetical protein